LADPADFQGDQRAKQGLGAGVVGHDIVVHEEEGAAILRFDLATENSRGIFLVLGNAPSLPELARLDRRRSNRRYLA